MKGRSNKTAHVLKLLAGTDAKYENPMINEDFKESNIIKKSELKEEPKEEVKEDIKIEEETPESDKLVNVIEVLVNENIIEVMNRFGSCSCNKCRIHVSLEVLDEIAPVYAVKNSADEKKLLISKKGNVMTGIVKSVLKLKSRPIH